MYLTPVKQAPRTKQPSQTHPNTYSNLPYKTIINQSRNNKHSVYLQKPARNHNVSAQTILNEVQTKKIDSIQIDYKEKAFQFMRKNTQLELNMKQARLDIENLQNQVEKFSGIMKEILGTFGVNGADGRKASEIIQNIQQHQKNRNQSHFHQELEEFKNIITQNMKHSKNSNSSSKQKQSQPELYATLQKNKYTQSMQFQPDYKNLSTERTNLKSDRNFHETSFQEVINQQNQPQCQCQEHYSTIISQYKGIIENQHNNIMKKEKSNKMLKKEIQEYKNIVEELRKNIATHQNQIMELQGKILAIEVSKRQEEQNKAKDRQKQSKIQARVKELQKLLQQSEKKVQSKTNENQQLFKERQKIKLKYKQQIVHFEEMEKLVEEKLIQVQYQMKFYKKERLENFQKIKRLQSQLKQYKSAEQKKYYSFGDGQKDIAIQVQQNQLASRTNNKGEFIVSSDNKISIKNNRKNQYPTKQQYNDENDDDDVPELKEVETNKIYRDPWQIQCYEQSIKTLLLENNRLKNCLVKLYKMVKGQDRTRPVDEQVEVELKMLLTTIGQQPAEEEDEEDQKQAQIIQNVKKGRRFISQP